MRKWTCAETFDLDQLVDTISRTAVINSELLETTIESIDNVNMYSMLTP
jgi:hypothetical protein